MKQKRNQVGRFATEDIATRRDLPIDNAVAEHGSSGGMHVLTSLGLELGGELLRRDLDDASLLIMASASIITVVDHF